MGETNKVRAKIHVLTPEEGGRRTGLFSGYRAGVFLGSDPSAGNDGIMTLEGHERCLPGHDCVARIEFAHPELLKGLLRPDAELELKEGSRGVGRGTIVEVE